MKKILMVSGDIGCAQSQLPVYKELMRQKASVRVIVDKSRNARAGSIWSKTSAQYSQVGANSREMEEAIRKCDILFSGSAGSAYKLEGSAVKLGNEMGKITVISSDFWFNHAFPQWTKANPSFWLAIDSMHQNDILRLRPKWERERVIISGQPAFDSIEFLRKRKIQIRKNTRNLYGIKNRETVIVFWSQGSVWSDLMEASFENMIIGLKGIGSYVSGIVFAPRIHPTICIEYKNKQMRKIERVCGNGGIRLIDAVKSPTNELNLSADLVISSFSTASIASALMGIPTLNILTRPYHTLLREYLGQTYPFLPTLRGKAAVGVFSKPEIVSGMLRALEPSVQKELCKNAQKMLLPKAAARIISFLEDL